MAKENSGQIFDSEDFDRKLTILKKIANKMCFEILAISAEVTHDASELERQLNINNISKEDE